MEIPSNLQYPEQKILYFFQQLKKQRFVETREISKATNLRSNLVFRHLRWFIKSELMRQIGIRRNTKYGLTPRGKRFLRLNGLDSIVDSRNCEKEL